MTTTPQMEQTPREKLLAIHTVYHRHPTDAEICEAYGWQWVSWMQHGWHTLEIWARRAGRKASIRHTIGQPAASDRVTFCLDALDQLAALFDAGAGVDAGSPLAHPPPPAGWDIAGGVPGGPLGPLHPMPLDFPRPSRTIEEKIYPTAADHERNLRALGFGPPEDRYRLGQAAAPTIEELRAAVVATSIALRVTESEDLGIQKPSTDLVVDHEAYVAELMRRLPERQRRTQAALMRWRAAVDALIAAGGGT